MRACFDRPRHVRTRYDAPKESTDPTALSYIRLGRFIGNCEYISGDIMYLINVLALYGFACIIRPLGTMI